MDKKISQLTSATLPLSGSEQLPIVQSGSTVKTTVDDILNAESITYAQAMSLISGADVVRGKRYRLTDFQTKHYLVDGNGGQDTSVVFTGTLEPLILTGASSTAFDSVAISSNYPQDIIHIDLNPNNFLKDLSFADVYNTGNIIPGFKGVIIYREDTKNANKFNFDFRNCKFRRWKANPPAWSSLTAYVVGDIVLYGAVIYYAHSASTNVTPSVSGSISWLPIVDCTLTTYVSKTSAQLSADPLDFIDTLMFAKTGVIDRYETGVKNNVFAPGFSDNDDMFYYNGTRLPNSVIYLADDDYLNVYDNIFSNSFVGNTITNFASFNSFVDFNDIVVKDFTSNSGNTWSDNYIYGRFSGGNNISTLYGCQLGSNFEYNVGANLSGTYANLFSNNKFTNIQQCNFKGVGSGNTIANMNNCNFNAGASNNYFNEYVSSLTTSSTLVFQRNTIQTGISGNYSAATHVYGVYSCTIVAKPNNTAALYYIDNANALVVAAATA